MNPFTTTHGATNSEAPSPFAGWMARHSADSDYRRTRWLTGRKEEVA